MQKLLISISLCASLLLGCSPHKLEIQQGNMITADMLEKLAVGMNKNQVRFILGSPQLTDPFHPNRWDYLYSLRENNEATERKHLVLYFENEILSRFEAKTPNLTN